MVTLLFATNASQPGRTELLERGALRSHEEVLNFVLLILKKVIILACLGIKLPLGELDTLCFSL